MSKYIQQAIRTESTIGAEDRIQNVFFELASLNEELVSTIENTADNLKKYIYYGKKPKNMTICDSRLGIPTSTVDKDTLRLLHAGLGMLTEAQEFLKPVLESLLDGKPLDIVNLKEELGDTMWYEAIACDVLGTTFEIEQDRNIAKLKKRYPDKYSDELAINRDVHAEREVLENDTSM